jgi:hypothetical protein
MEVWCRSYIIGEIKEPRKELKRDAEMGLKEYLYRLKNLT